jgi:hypothetical protein
MLEGIGAAGRGLALGRGEVLDGDGHPVEGPKRISCHHRLLGRSGGGQRLFGVDEAEGVQGGLHRLDAGERRLHDLDRRETAVGDPPRQLDRRQSAKPVVGHRLFPLPETYQKR